MFTKRTANVFENLFYENRGELTTNNTNRNRTYYITYEGVRAKNSFRTTHIKTSNLDELMDALYHAYCIPKFSTYTFRVWTGNWRESAELSKNLLTAKYQIQEFVAPVDTTFPKKR